MRCIFKMFKRICISNLFWNTILVSLGDASVDITVPSAGNCDDVTILICNSTVELQFTGWFGLGRSLLIGGTVVRPEDSNKYSQTVSGKTFSLIIKDTDITDGGEYSCKVGFFESTRTLLRVECRAKYVNLSLTRDRTIVIALDKIYPQPEIKLEILDLKNGKEITVSGTFTKKCPSSNSWLDCVWTSSSIFLDGNYSYNAAITTITTSTYTGYFRISNNITKFGTPDSINFSPNATIYRIEESRLMNDVTCSLDCAPVCQYAWRSDRGINISDSNVLSLGEVDRTADGMYTCLAWNWFGQVEMSIILEIMYGPENIVFTPSDTEYTKTEGEAMENIRCSVTCNHNCSVNWHKADTLVSNTGNLALKTIQRDDIGMCQCVATNNDIPGNPSVQRSIDINVRYGPDTVVLSSGSYISLVTWTLAPNITCSADCNPPCSFTWRNMTNNSVQSHGHIFSFGIAELAFQGEYRCTVTNNATGKSIYTTLTVTVESAELAEKGTSIGAIVGGAVGAVVLVCLIATATVLFYRKRKQNVSENTKEHKNDVYDQLDVTATVNPPDTAYEELKDRNDRKNDVYNQLDVAATVSENTKEQKNGEIKGGSSDTAYEELGDRNGRKNDVYDQLDVAVTDPCDDNEFHCDGICLSDALVCNGHKNCPDSGADERGCTAEEASGSQSKPVPLMVFILGGVGGLILVILIIGICVMCRYRRGQKNKRKPGVQRQDSQKRNALEMAVSDSTNTAHHLAKQNTQGSYYSLPRPAGHATMMQHRGSFSSKVPSEGDYGDHMSDSSTYKKFLQLEQNLDDDSSRCPSPYSPGFTTIIEQHPLPPGMTPDLGWHYQADGTGMPSLAENLSKLQQYTSFNPNMPKTIPTQAVEDPNTGMTMEFKYDPSPIVYPATKFRIKSPDVNYGWNPENKAVSPAVKSLTFKNQDAEVAPDLTREIETT